MTLYRRLRWAHGAVDVTTDQPVPPWVPGTRYAGDRARMADASLVVEERRRDELLDLVIRFRESEWPDVYAIATHLSRGGSAQLYLEASVDHAVSVYGVRPRLGDRIRPTRTQNGDLLELPITVRKVTAGAGTWTEEYRGTIQADTAFQRTSATGKLFAYGYDLSVGLDPFNPADWTLAADLALVLGVDNRLVVTASAGGFNRFFYHTATAVRQKALLFLQGRTQDGTSDPHLKLAALVADITGGSEDMGAQALMTITRTIGTAELSGLNELVNGAGSGVSDVSSGVAAKVVDTDYAMSLWVDGTVPVAIQRDFTLALDHTIAPGTHTAAGRIGSGTQATVELARLVASAGRYIDVSDVPTGGSVEIRRSDETVLQVQAENGAGGAQFDGRLFGVPDYGRMAHVVVLDSGGGEVRRASPAEGVWPGETYALVAL